MEYCSSSIRCEMTAKIGSSTWIVIALGSGQSLKRCRRRRSIFFAITSTTTTFQKLSQRWTGWQPERVSTHTSKSTGFDGIPLAFSPETDVRPEPGIRMVISVEGFENLGVGID